MSSRWVTVLLMTLVVVSLFVLGAHFLRERNSYPFLAVLLMIPLLNFRRPWVARTVQAVLFLGGCEWVRTLAVLLGERQAAGEPAVRMAVILGAVAALTFAAALAFEAAGVRELYRSEPAGRATGG